MLTRLSLTGLIFAIAAGIGGCGQDDLENHAHAAKPAEGRSLPVAVLNLDAVARELGISEQIDQTIQSQGAQWQSQLKEQQEAAEQKMRDYVRDMGDSPTQKQQQAFARRRAEIAAELQQRARFAQQNVTGLRSRLSQSFAEAVRPIARQVSKDAGADVVLLASGNLYAYDESVEITEAVATEVGRKMDSGELDWSVDKVIQQIQAQRQAALDRAQSRQQGAGGAADEPAGAASP